MPTLFTRIINGEIPGAFVFRDEHWVGFLDLFPVQPGHLLLVPRCEAALLEQLPAPVLATLGPVTARATACLTKALGCDAVSVLLRNGAAAGQEIPHVHVHCVPRRQGDPGGFKPGRYGPDDAAVRTAMTAMAARLATAW